MECLEDYITTDGRPYNNISMFKFTIADGKIKKVREYCKSRNLRGACKSADRR